MALNLDSRKRKTKDPCSGCGLHKSLCLCDEIPKLRLKTKLTLIIHAKELKRTTNTGQLALRALLNSEMRVRGQGREALDLTDLLSPDYESVLFYPADEALELDRDFLKGLSRPVQLIVPDGNWRQASKVHTRHPELKHLPRVKISAPNQSSQHLRAEHMAEGMATLEAIGKAFEVLEGIEVGQRLANLYNLKLHRTLKARGQFDEDSQIANPQKL